VRATFANDDETLWPGTLVNVTIPLSAGQPALTVPEVAIQHSQNGDYVYVIDNSNIAHRRDVKVARMQGGQAVVSAGVNAGERVAVDGMMSIKDGGKVDISRTPAEQPAS
jgi:multidrug efflux system membrane fusion protein